MIRQVNHSIEKEVAPHAIFWRPISYFAVDVHLDDDNLDQYKYISYAIDNNPFELRVYKGQPQSTTTLYLPEDIEDEEKILALVGRVMAATTVPQTSLAWKRGEAYRYGELDRVSDDQLREPEAGILALKIAAGCNDHTASIDHIESQVPNRYSLSEIDKQPSPSSGHRSRWQGIVGSLPFGDPSYNMFDRGYARMTDGRMQVTEDGIGYLNDIGFLQA